MTVIGGQVFPAFEQLGDWPELSLPLLRENACLIYRRCVDAVSETSAIVAAFRPPPTGTESGVVMHAAEREALAGAVAGAQSALNDFTELRLRHPNEQLLLEAHELLVELGATAEQEAEMRNHGAPQWHGFAAELMAGMRGAPAERYLIHLGAMIALSEWDLEPLGALDRVNAAIACVDSRASAEGSKDDDA